MSPLESPQPAKGKINEVDGEWDWLDDFATLLHMIDARSH